MIGWLLLLWAFGILIWASWSDIKTREVADEISLLFIAGALVLRLAGSFPSSSFLWEPLAAGAFFGAIGLIFYIFKQWGGADFLLIMGLGFSFGSLPSELSIFFRPQLSFYPFAVTLLLNLLFVGAAYGIAWVLWLVLKNSKMRNRFFQENYPFLVFAAVLFLVSFWAPFLKFLGFLVLLWAIFQAARLIEGLVFVKRVPLAQLREEDWLVEDIKIRGKMVVSADSPGITNEDLAALKPFMKLRLTAKIKEGVPFVPVFPLALFFTLIFGDLLLLVFSFF